MIVLSTVGPPTIRRRQSAFEISAFWREHMCAQILRGLHHINYLRGLHLCDFLGWNVWNFWTRTLNTDNLSNFFGVQILFKDSNLFPVGHSLLTGSCFCHGGLTFQIRSLVKFTVCTYKALNDGLKYLTLQEIAQM